LFIVDPHSPNAQNFRTITATATNIVVTFSTAPVTGTGNLLFHWYAKEFFN
jgi:hypothetical protein